jgi:L-asparaginase II
MSGSARVEIWRGDAMEAVHRVSVAVVDAEGRVGGTAGRPDERVYARSAVKPFQAVPVVEDGVDARFGFGSEALALCCGSHNGEPFHVQAAALMLRRIGCDEDALACGPHPPLGADAAHALAAAGVSPGRLHNNCSGKHAGMLGLARFHGWSVAGYEKAEHPVQRRMLAEVVRWCEVPEADVGTALDGCGVITFGLPLHRLAAGFARFARAVRCGVTGPARVAQAMTSHPEYVAGTGRLCTALMRVAGERIVAKVGAEGVYCAAVPQEELGVALKVEDGARRASEPALLAVLNALGVLSDSELDELGVFASPVVTNTLGQQVGVVRAVVRLEAKRG